MADGKVSDTGTLDKLVERRTRDVVEAATGPATQAGSVVRAVRADKAGNVWAVSGRTLRVWTGKVWLDGTKALKDLGSLKGEALYLSAVGDGSKVYVADVGAPGDQGKAFLGEVKEGQLVFSPAPCPNDKDLLWRGLRDQEGALWLTRILWRSELAVPEMTGQKAFRVTPAGTDQELTNAGWPLLCDKGGNVWLGGIFRGRPQDFNLWRGGKIAATVSIPGAGLDRPYGTPMASNRPGSVFAYTQAGLVHLTAEDPKAPARFTVKAVYHLQGQGGRVRSMEYSELGYLLLRYETPLPTFNSKTWSVVVAVPKD